MYQEIIKTIEPELEKTIKFLEGELMKIRTSQASPSLVEDIIVNCFGSEVPIKQLGAISCPEPRKIVIQPWDKSYLEPIEKALNKTNLGMSPIVDQDLIRLMLPILSDEYRKNLLNVLSVKAEEARQTVRRWREDAWKKIQEGFKEKTIREDDKFKAKDELQKLVDKYNKKIEELRERKKREISE